MVNAYKSISLSRDWNDMKQKNCVQILFLRGKKIFSFDSVDWFVFNSPPIYHSFQFVHFFFLFFSVLSNSTTTCNDVYKIQIMTAFPAEDKLFLFFYRKKKKNIFLVHHFLVVTACGISSSHAISIIFLYLLTTTKKNWIKIFSNLLCLSINNDNFFVLFHFTCFIISWWSIIDKFSR